MTKLQEWAFALSAFAAIYLSVLMGTLPLQLSNEAMRIFQLVSIQGKSSSNISQQKQKKGWKCLERS